MKRVDGVAWSALIEDPAHPAWERVGVPGGDRLAAQLAILSSVCSALHYAHRRGVIHRDVKPANVMVGELGEVYLVDWGVATALDPADPRFRKRRLALVGTPGFIAPEMVADDGGEVDARTDVYLLGTTLHTVLTGEARHRGDSLLAMFCSASLSTPVSYGPDVPDELAAIANRATERLPERRYPSAAALREAIGEFLMHRASITLSDNARRRLDALHGLAPDPGVAARLMECRYGFAHALESWPGNARAQEGLRACALLGLRHELARANLVGAEERLLELDGAAPDDAARRTRGTPVARAATLPRGTVHPAHAGELRSADVPLRRAAHVAGRAGGAPPGRPGGGPSSPSPSRCARPALPSAARPSRRCCSSGTPRWRGRRGSRSGGP